MCMPILITASGNPPLSWNMWLLHPHPTPGFLLSLWWPLPGFLPLLLFISGIPSSNPEPRQAIQITKAISKHDAVGGPRGACSKQGWVPHLQGEAACHLQFLRKEAQCHQLPSVSLKSLNSRWNLPLFNVDNLFDVLVRGSVADKTKHIFMSSVCNDLCLKDQNFLGISFFFLMNSVFFSCSVQWQTYSGKLTQSLGIY